MYIMRYDISQNLHFLKHFIYEGQKLSFLGSHILCMTCDKTIKSIHLSLTIYL